MKLIGGFFELALSGKNKVIYHDNTVALSSGRACFNFILQQTNPAKVYLPFFTCDALLEPLSENKISFEFYSIDRNLEPVNAIDLSENEFFLYINYFGIKNEFINDLLSKYSGNLIVDNAQAFFERGYGNAWSFNSARKFFGVPDGSYLYSPKKLDFDLESNTSINCSHLINRLIGKQSQAYEEFKEYEKTITSEIKLISVLSENLLQNINYQFAAERRKNNFKIYHASFNNINKLKIDLNENCVPFAYPLLLDKELNKTIIHKKGIFIPTFWNDVLNRKQSGFEFEKGIVRKLLPLPVDQRYGEEECKIVIDSVKAII